MIIVWIYLVLTICLHIIHIVHTTDKKNKEFDIVFATELRLIDEPRHDFK